MYVYYVYNIDIYIYIYICIPIFRYGMSSFDEAEAQLQCFQPISASLVLFKAQRR